MIQPPKPGDLVWLSRSASPQFAAAHPSVLRVISARRQWDDDLWLWLDGYQLDRVGEAIERRTVYVRLEGLMPAPAPAPTEKRTPAAAPRTRRQRGSDAARSATAA